MTVWALAVYFGLAILVVLAMLSISYVLGERHSDPATATPFESGIVSTGSAHVRLSVKFYLIAMFFVVFDLEAIFIFLWAVAGRELGWAGFGEALLFIFVLSVTLGYLWRTGALDWYKSEAAMGGKL